jgi:hypothetical protein
MSSWVLNEPARLDAVTVYVPSADEVGGVPDRSPVLVLNERPSGNAGKIEYKVGLLPVIVGAFVPGCPTVNIAGFTA